MRAALAWSVEIIESGPFLLYKLAIAGCGAAWASVAPLALTSALISPDLRERERETECTVTCSELSVHPALPRCPNILPVDLSTGAEWHGLELDSCEETLRGRTYTVTISWCSCYHQCQYVCDTAVSQ